METLATTCRICESACGLLADVEDGRVVGLRPDPDHPVSQGYACRKGTTFHERLARGDRITRPRVGGKPVDWDTALAAAGDALDRLADRHGPGAVGLYSGNAIGHSFSGVLGLEAFQKAFPGCKHYSCLTLDNSEQYVVADWVFGHPLTTFVADYRGSDAIVLFGTDPLSSQPSQAQSHPRGSGDLRARRDVLVVVDPRASMTSRAASVHLAPRVSTDVFLLAWLVRQALSRDSTRPEDERQALRAALAPFGLDRVCAVTGLTPEALTDLDAQLARARRPLVWSGLGILLGPHGTLGWWLTVCLQVLLTGVGPGMPWRPGGSPGFRRVLQKVPLVGADPSRPSRIGGWPAILGTHPAATMAADIATPGPDQLRGLVVVGGEPFRSLPDSASAGQALSSLDTLVCIGMFGGPTADAADVFLPAASFLERSESAAHNFAQRPFPHLRLDPPVMEPVGEVRSDWDILIGLCRAAGRRPFGSSWVDRLLGWTGVHPERIVGWVDRFKDRGDPLPIEPELAVPQLLEALAMLPDPEAGLRLLTTVRPPNAMNHWIRPKTEPAARMHPEDLADAGIAVDAERIRVVLEGPAGQLAIEVTVDAGLSRGTVVVPFGGPDNPNVLVGTGSLEPFSGQPWSNGTYVRVRGTSRA